MGINIDSELAKTLHIHSDELPFVDGGFNTKYRILQARPSEGLYSLQLRAEPGAETMYHKHRNHILGFTLTGMWGHNREYLYRPGTYIYETPGVIHRFLNGPGETDVVFMGDPTIDFVDPETLEVVSSLDGEIMLETYIATCKDMGVSARYLP